MRKIGGNITAEIQIKTTTKNAIGERVANWTNVQELTGYLDYIGGQADYNNYDAKITETTHVFICDYVTLSNDITIENCRCIIEGKEYEVVCIDNPMELNYQLEILLKYIGDVV